MRACVCVAESITFCSVYISPQTDVSLFQNTREICLYVRVCAFMCACVCLCVQACVYPSIADKICPHTQARTCTQYCELTDPTTHTHACPHERTHTHSHTHTRTYPLAHGVCHHGDVRHDVDAASRRDVISVVDDEGARELTRVDPAGFVRQVRVSVLQREGVGVRACVGVCVCTCEWVWMCACV